MLFYLLIIFIWTYVILYNINKNYIHVHVIQKKNVKTCTMQLYMLLTDISRLFYGKYIFGIHCTSFNSFARCILKGQIIAKKKNISISLFRRISPSYNKLLKLNASEIHINTCAKIFSAIWIISIQAYSSR